jgi:chromate reductase
MKKLKILAIAGSLRKNSFNRAVAREAQKIVGDRADFEILDWSDVPFMNEDAEFPAPESVKRVREAVKAADGVWFFTPEYNHSVPGVLKNLIDWLSRPVDAAERQVLIGKSATVSGVGAGPFGAILAIEQLAALLNYLDMDVMNQPRTAIASAYSLLQPDGALALGASEKFLKEQADAFLAFIETRRK